MKNIYRAFLYLIYKKRRFQVLIVPVLFLLIEIGMSVNLNWQLFGEKFSISNTETTIQNPLIAVSFLHSDRVLNPLGNFSIERSTFSFFSAETVIEACCTLLSLLAAYAGIFISMLWISRFFHENHLNLVWWTWPTSCATAHVLFFFLPKVEILEQSIMAVNF